MDYSIEMLVEIPYLSSFKYEVDKKTGLLRLDRPLNRQIPFNYGYVPRTLHKDGDPLDVCVLSLSPIQPLATARVTIVGALKCIDNGAQDDKLLVTIPGEILSQGDFDSQLTDIKAYLNSYKEGFVVGKQVDADVAYQIMLSDVEAYLHD